MTKNMVTPNFNIWMYIFYVSPEILRTNDLQG